MSDYEEVKSMVNAAALLANAAKAEMRRVEAEEEMGFIKNQKKNSKNKSNNRVPKGTTVDIAQLDVPQIEVIDVDGMHCLLFASLKVLLLAGSVSNQLIHWMHVDLDLCGLSGVNHNILK